MPITKQVIKRVKQAKVRTARNKHYNNHMKSMIKLLLTYVKAKDVKKAEKILSDVVSSIDTCTKKNIIHKNNAAHKKSRIQKAMNKMGDKKTAIPAKEEKKKVEKVEKKETK